MAAPLTAQDNKDKPPVGERFPAEAAKVEPGVQDMKKLATALAELRSRIDQLETQFASKAECAKMGETVTWLKGRVERMQDEMLAMRGAGPVTQTSAMAPRPMPEEVMPNRQDPAMPADALMRKLDENTRALQEFGRMKQQLETHTNAINELRRQHLGMQEDLSRAQNSVGRLEQEFARMRGDARLTPTPADSERRASMALPLPPDAVAPPPLRPQAGFGTIRLINSYLMPVNVVVDGRVHTLASNQTMNLDRPAGYFNYEVLGIQGNTLRTLNVGETMTIQVVPR
jgi:hypothetical protein